MARRYGTSCDRCGVAFTYRSSSDTPQRFCSRACYNASRNVTKACARCGEPFTVWRCLAARRKYCSLRCAGVAFRPDKFEQVQCIVCGVTFTARTKEHRVACSSKCAGQCRRIYARSQRRRVDTTPWLVIRARIITRDGEHCVLCASTDGLVVHHLVAWRHGGDDSDANLATLCRACHADEHFAPDRLTERLRAAGFSGPLVPSQRWTPELRRRNAEQTRARWTGRAHTDAARRTISEKAKARFADPAYRERMRAAGFLRG